MKRILSILLQRLHRDDRGNLAILLLLTLWVLVLLIALVWNSGEAAARKQQAQNAADAAARAAATWTSRTSNQVSATNMLIVQNACAEAVWRSYRDTMNVIENRLNREKDRLQQLWDQVQIDREQNPGDAVIQLRCDLLEQAIQTAVQAIEEEVQRYTGWISPVAGAMYSRQGGDFLRERDEIRSYQQQICTLTIDAANEERLAVRDFTRCSVTYALPLSRAPEWWEYSRDVHAPLRSTQYTNVPPIHHGGTTVQQPYVDPRTGQQRTRDIHIRGGAWGQIDCPPFARYYYNRIARDFGDIAQRGEDLRYVDEVRQQLGQILRDLLTPPPDTSPDMRRAYQQARQRIDRLRLADRFAYDQWIRTAHAWRSGMLHRLGNEPQMVLVTYHHYPIPNWARASVYNQVYNMVYRDVMARNWDKPAPQRAEGAAKIAQDIATRWIHRSWPYEIRPPDDPVPPTPGLSDSDRLAYFTVVTAALADARAGANPLLPKLFSSADDPAGAYAQSETFNWMEYHGHYGAGDRYDHAYPPRPWRVSTIGGWNWRPRLALCDSLHATLNNNPEFEDFFQQSGVRAHDHDTIQNITLH